MSAGILFDSIKVEGNLICDGHHRYIATLLANFPLERESGYTTQATICIDWKLVTFDEADWDTPAKIKVVNELDAEYNNLPLQKIIDLLK